MSYEERHAISTAWIKALEWQYFYQRCGDMAKAQRWANRAAKLKKQVLSDDNHA
jgi:hypothetical protein